MMQTGVASGHGLSVDATTTVDFAYLPITYMEHIKNEWFELTFCLAWKSLRMLQNMMLHVLHPAQRSATAEAGAAWDQRTEAAFVTRTPRTDAAYRC